MDDLLAELELENVTLESLKLCLEERENYSGTIFFNISIDVVENICNTCNSVKKAATSGDIDVQSLKKLALYISCLIYQSSDPNGTCIYDIIHQYSIFIN